MKDPLDRKEDSLFRWACKSSTLNLAVVSICMARNLVSLFEQLQEHLLVNRSGADVLDLLGLITKVARYLADASDGDCEDDCLFHGQLVCLHESLGWGFDLQVQTGTKEMVTVIWSLSLKRCKSDSRIRPRGFLVKKHFFWV